MTKEARKESGKFLMDVAKLLIGGTILSSIIKIEGISLNSVIFVGGTFDIIFVIGGLMIFNSVKDK